MNHPVPRKSLPKALRFEVFKRDHFKCQYCGRAAPEIVLHVDHVDPVAEGGTNNILNLITSCIDCNLGKGSRKLSENVALQKQRDILEELQERREQLEMMMQWRGGLQDLKDITAKKVADYWHELTPGWTVSEHGLASIKKWLLKMTVDEILSAMDIAATQYIQRDVQGKITSESWELAFSKITGICRVTKLEKEEPDLKELYYIRGIIRNRLRSYFDNAKCLQLLKKARSWGVSLDELRSIAYEVTSWTSFNTGISEAIEQTPTYRRDRGESAPESR